MSDRCKKCNVLLEQDMYCDKCKATNGHAAIIKECAELIPTNWLDPLLIGENAVINSDSYYTNKDIEDLLCALKQRILSRVDL